MSNVTVIVELSKQNKRYKLNVVRVCRNSMNIFFKTFQMRIPFVPETCETSSNGKNSFSEKNMIVLPRRFWIFSFSSRIRPGLYSSPSSLPLWKPFQNPKQINDSNFSFVILLSLLNVSENTTFTQNYKSQRIQLRRFLWYYIFFSSIITL